MKPGLASRIGQQLAILVLFLCYAVPLATIIVASFKSNADIVNDPAGLVFTPTLTAYEKVFQSDFLTALGNSMFIAIGTTLLTVIAASLLAYVLARTDPRWTAVVIGVLIALQMTPAATAIIPQYQVVAGLGLLGSKLGVVLAMSALLLPYATLLLRPFYLSIPYEIEEAGQIDGAGPFSIYVRLILPLMRNGIGLVGVLLFIAAWGDFIHPMSFLNNQAEFPLSVLLAQQQGIYGTEWNSLMALAVVGSIPTIVIFAFVARKLSSGLALGVGK